MSAENKEIPQSSLAEMSSEDEDLMVNDAADVSFDFIMTLVEIIKKRGYDFAMEVAETLDKLIPSRDNPMDDEDPSDNPMVVSPDEIGKKLSNIRLVEDD